MRTIDFPDEWATGKPIDNASFKSPDGSILIASILLDDGSGLWSLIFDGGHRFARTAACTGWAIEERFHGDPTPAETEQVNEMWRTVLRLMIEAAHEGADRQADHRTSTRPLTAGRAQLLAQDYYDDGRGWSIAAIRRHLAERGVHVGWNTVKIWADPKFAESVRRDGATRSRLRCREQHGLRAPRVFDEDALRRRVQALAAVGVPSGSIAAVIRLDHGILLSANRVTKILAGEPLPARVLGELARAA
jgi:hypothetical protein